MATAEVLPRPQNRFTRASEQRRKTEADEASRRSVHEALCETQGRRHPAEIAIEVLLPGVFSKELIQSVVEECGGDSDAALEVLLGPSTVAMEPILEPCSDVPNQRNPEQGRTVDQPNTDGDEALALRMQMEEQVVPTSTTNQELPERETERSRPETTPVVARRLVHSHLQVPLDTEHRAQEREFWNGSSDNSPTTRAEASQRKEEMSEEEQLQAAMRLSLQGTGVTMEQLSAPKQQQACAESSVATTEIIEDIQGNAVAATEMSEEGNGWTLVESQQKQACTSFAPVTEKTSFAPNPDAPPWLPMLKTGGKDTSSSKPTFYDLQTQRLMAALKAPPQVSSSYTAKDLHGAGKGSGRKGGS